LNSISEVTVNTLSYSVDQGRYGASQVDCVRRTCTRLCHLAGGELEQIQFLLGYASVQTTERYLGCNQRLSQAVNDNLGLEDA